MAGERQARAALERAGLRIEAARHTAAGVEIDLVAWDGPTLVFIEVRWRREDRRGDPVETVDARKRGRLIRGAKGFLVERGLWNRVPVRFDVVGIVGEEVRWVRDAFWS